MQYLVIKIMQINGDSPKDAVERAEELEAHGGWPAFVQVANRVTEAAAEACLLGAVEAVEGPGIICSYEQLMKGLPK